jgi:hypothetical protein
VFDLSGATAFGSGVRIGNWQVRPASLQTLPMLPAAQLCPEISHVCIPLRWFVWQSAQHLVLHLLLRLPCPSVSVWPMSVSAAVLLQHVGSLRLTHNQRA